MPLPGAALAPPSLWRMLGRALLRHCPRCGSGRVFATWFRMKPACPGCGLRFEREGDFFLGAYVINLAVTEGLLALALFAYILRLASDPGMELKPVLITAVVVAVVAPIAFFPFARTTWAAIDLAMRPVPREDGDGSGFGGRA